MLGGRHALHDMLPKLVCIECTSVQTYILYFQRAGLRLFVSTWPVVNLHRREDCCSNRT